MVYSKHGSFTLQADAKKHFAENYLPLTLAKLEKTAALNNSTKGWIKGDKVSRYLPAATSGTESISYIEQ